MKDVFAMLAQGGVVMIPIGLGSVVALAVFLERIWSLQRNRIIPHGLVDRLVDLIKKGERRAARDECLRSNSPMGRVILGSFDFPKMSREELKGIFEEVGRHEVARMDRFVETVGTIAGIEPLLGLLGTVTGMIQVFQKVVSTSRSGAVDPSLLANGIWQALITTAAGLSVAIVAFIGYRYLQSVTDRHALEMEEGALRIADLLINVDVSQKDTGSGVEQ